MKSKTILVCILVAGLGIASAVAGFAAEFTKVKKSQINVVLYGLQPECEYPSSPAMGIAIAAVVALLIARGVITSTTGGCCSCCHTIPNLPKLARVCLVISWITSSVAVILFLVGVKLSTKKGVETMINGVYKCYTVKPGLFLGAGIIGLVSVFLALVYYLSFVSAQNGVVKKSTVDLELKATPITDGKKKHIPSQNHRKTENN